MVLTMIATGDLQITLRVCVNLSSQSRIIFRINSGIHLSIVILFKNPNDISRFKI